MTRAVVTASVVVIASVYVIVGACFAGLVGIAAMMAPPSDPASRAAADTYFEGHELYDQGDYEGALQRYVVYRDHQEQRGKDASEVEGLIAYCHDLAGRPDQALALFDKSLASDPLWYVRVKKAHCLRRHRGLDAARTWLDDEQMGDDDRCRVLGSFHAERGAHAEAIPWFVRLLELRGWPSFHYDEQQGAVIGLPKTIDNETHNRLADCSYPIGDLAESHLALKQDDAAFRYATMGVAVGRVLHRDATYAGAAYVQAGDVSCRLVRAYVFINRRNWSSARAEIDFARAIADWGSYTGYTRAVQRAEDRLEKQQNADEPPR